MEPAARGRADRRGHVPGQDDPLPLPGLAPGPGRRITVNEKKTVTVAGVGVSGYNGTFPVVSVLNTTQFTYVAGATGLANSG